MWSVFLLYSGCSAYFIEAFKLLIKKIRSVFIGFFFDQEIQKFNRTTAGVVRCICSVIKFGFGIRLILLRQDQLFSGSCDHGNV